jgi:hypothetical protein
MTWLDEATDSLAENPLCGYAADAAPASEPTALAALALHANGHGQAARPALDFLSRLQAKDGSVGVREGEPTPGWPTSLAVIAWRTIDPRKFEREAAAGLKWILEARGETLPRAPQFGHDTEIAAWSYAENTHSWVEPTAFAVAALKRAGLSQHKRTRDGVRMLLDRLLPGGGCNYGNTYVLGQLLRPHVQPTGIALLALAGEQDADGRIAKSVAWLRRSLVPETTASSLSWGLIGLSAHGVHIPESDEWLKLAYERVMRRDRSPHKLVLLVLAAKGWPA